METIKNLLIDSLNGFSPRFIPLFLFQLLVAGFLGHLLQKIVNRKAGTVVLEYSGVVALSVALMASLVKYSLPFAVLAAAVLLVLSRAKDYSFVQLVGLFLVMSIGVGCGIGSVVQVLIGYLLVITVILFTPLKK